MLVLLVMLCFSSCCALRCNACGVVHSSAPVALPANIAYCSHPTGNCLQLGEDDIADVQPIDRYGTWLHHETFGTASMCKHCQHVQALPTCVKSILLSRYLGHAHKEFHSNPLCTDVCTEIPGFSEGADLKDVAGLVADLLNKDDESRDKVIGEIVARETLIFESLVDGRYAHYMLGLA